MLVYCGAAVQQDICDATGLPGALGMIQSRFGAHSYGADLGLYKNLQESSSADSRHKLHPAPNSLIYSTTTSGRPESQECSVHTADQSSPVQSSPVHTSIQLASLVPFLAHLPKDQLIKSLLSQSPLDFACSTDSFKLSKSLNSALSATPHS